MSSGRTRGGPALTRRRFLQLSTGALALAAVPVRMTAQEESSASTGAPMTDDAYRPVQLPPRGAGAARITDAQRDELEHRLQCRCGCTLDVYTCRTTDFTCPVSPRMHADVMGLVSGGYSADDILSAFRRVYGERVLMSPVKQGFNWLGYLLPFGAIGTGAVALAGLIRHWSQPAGGSDVPPAAVDATPAELAELRHAIRRDA